MDFPILRKHLQALSLTHDSELFEKQVKEHITKEVNRITHFVLLAAENGDKHYICRYPEYIFNVYFQKKVIGEKWPSVFINCGPNALKRCVIPDIVNELKLKFPDTTIISDQNNSYILIDWS